MPYRRVAGVVVVEVLDGVVDEMGLDGKCHMQAEGHGGVGWGELGVKLKPWYAASPSGNSTASCQSMRG